MKLKTISTIFFLFVLLSCGDDYNDDLDPSKIDFGQNDIPPPTELDNWIFENLTVPYNISVKYRWDASELDLNKTLVPPMVSKVQPIMSVVHDAWIVPYAQEAGVNFLKTFSPKNFVLVGSPAFNPDGTVTLGTAEGGRKIVLFTLNEFNEDNRRMIKEQMHTVHHEFAHILHQNILYSSAYKQITPGEYTADWTNVPLDSAHARGFITSYSMSAPDEDFVEMIATMLTEGRRGFDRIVCSIPNASAQQKIRQKQQIVVSYFNEVYNIDFYQLQQRTQAAIDAYAAKTLLSELGFNQGQFFNGIRVDPSLLPALSEEFQNIYDATFDNFTALDGLIMKHFTLYFTGDDSMVLGITYSEADTPGESLFAFFSFNLTTLPSGAVTLEYDEPNQDSPLIEQAAGPMLSYFEDYTFQFETIPADADGCVYDLGGFYPQENPDAFGFGTLSKTIE